MIKALLRIALTAVSLLIIAQAVAGISIANFYIAILIAVVWGLMMLIVRPVLKILTLPITFLTLGIFNFVLNALLFWLMSAFVPGFVITGFIPALEGSVLLTVVGWILNAFL